MPGDALSGVGADDAAFADDSMNARDGDVQSSAGVRGLVHSGLRLRRICSNDLEFASVVLHKYSNCSSSILPPSDCRQLLRPRRNSSQCGRSSFLPFSAQQVKIPKLPSNTGGASPGGQFNASKSAPDSVKYCAPFERCPVNGSGRLHANIATRRPYLLIERYADGANFACSQIATDRNIER